MGQQEVTWGQLSGFSQVSKFEPLSSLSKALCLQKQEDSWKWKLKPLILVALTSGPLTPGQDL